jgi:hypothetical protein
MQSAKLTAYPRFPTLGSLDEEFGVNELVIPAADARPRWRWYLWFSVLSITLGLTSAVIWSKHSRGFYSKAELLVNSSVGKILSRDSTGAAQRLDVIEALKRDINELRDLQQQMRAEVNGLQTAYWQSRSSLEHASWYSERSAWTYQQTTPPRPQSKAAVGTSSAAN